MFSLHQASTFLYPFLSYFSGCRAWSGSVFYRVLAAVSCGIRQLHVAWLGERNVRCLPRPSHQIFFGFSASAALYPVKAHPYYIVTANLSATL